MMTFAERTEVQSCVARTRERARMVVASCYLGVINPPRRHVLHAYVQEDAAHIA